MSHTSMILSSLMMMAMLVFFAPNIFALNRGHILRNIALWLAIFLGLALFYQNFGPDSPHPLFQTPAAMQGMKPTPPLTPPPASKDKIDKDTKDDDGSGAQGFTPPKED
jgi:cytochrome c biogenesis protein CcdA